MLEQSILENNLNSKITYKEFFHALGYKDGDTMYLRRFDDRKRDEMLPKNMEVELSRFDSILPTLHRYNDELFGIFYVVNGGGHGDKEVKRAGGPARAQFVDFDDDSFQDQLRKLNEFPLEPSILIRTRKSLHAYWILDNGEMKYFREIQQRLAQHFGSDTTMQNESRVMRVFGFNHCKLEPIRTLNGFEPGTEEEPVLVRVIKFDPELHYTQRQLHEVLPLLERSSTGTGTRERREIEKDGELVPIGQRHYYVVSRIGTILNKIGDVATDEMIYAMLEADYLEHCEDAESTDLEKFRTKYLATIKKFREQREAEENDPDFYKKAVQAWEYYNAERFDREKTSWEEVAEAGRRAEEEGLDLDQKFEELRRSVERAKGREYPTPTKTPAEDAQKSEPSASSLLLSLNSIEEEEAEWLIPGRIPAKTITTIGGDGGSGKTTLWSDLAACISSGKKPLLAGDIPNAYWEEEPARVLYFSTEDSSKVVLKKKLRKSGANFDNISTVDLKNIDLIKYNSPQLAELFEIFKPKLCIFDPLQGFFDARLDMSKRNAIRQGCIAPLATLAEKYGTAIVIIAHSNKRDGASDRGRLADSADIWDGSRSVLMVGKTKDGDRYISQEKSNYGPLSDTIIFTINGGAPTFKELSKKHDRDFVNERFDMKRNAPAREEAREVILEALRSAGGTMPADELNEYAESASISPSTLRRVKADMKKLGKIEYVKEGVKGKGQGVKTLIRLIESPEATDEEPALDLRNLELDELGFD